VCGALCSVMQYCVANKLTYKAIGELLKLLHILCPPESQLPSSFYKFKKVFQQFSNKYDHKAMCTKCGTEKCSCMSRSSSNTAHVVHLDIQKQLENVLSRKSCVTSAWML
jgi:hypothetical protein